MPDSPPARSADALVTTYSHEADAVQWVTLTGSPTGGTFTLTFGGDTTSSIAYNASASTVQSDLATLGSIGSGNVEVTLVPGGGWQVHFAGSLAGVYQNQMTATSSLTGGTSPGVSVNTISLGGDNGNVVDTTDPDEIDTRDYYNSLGQVVQEVQDYTNGVVTADSNKTTDYTYNSVGQTSLTADMGNGTGETTEWVYGVTTGTGSVIDSNDIVGVTEQPNPSTGLPDSSLETTVTVDGLGETLTSTDPDGTTHTYSYDVLGQKTADAVTTLGSGVDGSVREITTSYTTLGNPYITTSYASDDGGTVVNQVEDIYNGLDQLTQEYQSVSGSVNTETTPTVQYIYNDLGSSENNSRLTEIIYPDGYTVDYNYASGLDNNISRLTSISDDTGTLESYKYLGLSTIVEMDHPETDINLTYISQDDETGVAGDQYTGLDQFGRVIEQNWYDTATSSSVYDEQYGYDEDGNVLYEIDGVNSSFGALYQYDGLGQLTSYWQGDVTISEGVVGITGSATIEESWTYDELGNHLVDSTTTTGTTTTTSTFNLDNQITSMSGYTTPTYDNDGNMTKDQNNFTYVYNAWGQLVTVKNSGGSTLENYTYDGLGDRMTHTVSGTQTNFYYSTSGQVLEEQANSSGDYTQRYVWSVNYINEMINRDTSTSGSLTATGSSFTRIWAVNDANYDVVAIVLVSDSVASVVERYEYDPFGTQTVLSAGYATEGSSSYGWVYGFQGMKLDGVTGNSLSLTREMDPTTGMWTSEDPTGFGGGDQDLYGFVGNEPMNSIDPSGLVEPDLPKNKWPSWWKNLEGHWNGSEKDVDEFGTGTEVEQVLRMIADFQHPGGAHYDVYYKVFGREKPDKMRVWKDGMPLNDYENRCIDKGIRPLPRDQQGFSVIRQPGTSKMRSPAPTDLPDWLTNPSPFQSPFQNPFIIPGLQGPSSGKATNSTAPLYGPNPTWGSQPSPVRIPPLSTLPFILPDVLTEPVAPAPRPSAPSFIWPSIPRPVPSYGLPLFILPFPLDFYDGSPGSIPIA